MSQRVQDAELPLSAIRCRNEPSAPKPTVVHVAQSSETRVQQDIHSRKRAASAEPPGLQDAPLAAMPTNVRPMLATLVHKPFDRRGWLFEIKWYGYREIAEVDKCQVRLYSRSGLSLTKRYWPITVALQSLSTKRCLTARS
jgi:bifunctional non-homologous end joining protein LigD